MDRWREHFPWRMVAAGAGGAEAGRGRAGADTLATLSGSNPACGPRLARVPSPRGAISFRGHGGPEQNTRIPRFGRWVQAENREKPLFSGEFSHITHTEYIRNR